MPTQGDIPDVVLQAGRSHDTTLRFFRVIIGLDPMIQSCKGQRSGLWIARSSRAMTVTVVSCDASVRSVECRIHLWKKIPA